jgi:ABC-type uncharacterized transport system permease subunit
MNSEHIVLIISILAASIRMAVPLAYAAIGGAIAESSGIMALCLEGYMIVGAFFAVVGSWLSGSPWVGLLFACISSGLTALIYGIFSIKYNANQVVSGLGINILTPGLTTILLVGIWHNKGKSDIVNGFLGLNIPLLDKIPVIGPIFSGHNILTYLLIVVAVIAWVVIFKTPVGIRLRATGENPAVVDSLGLHANRIRYAAVMLSGALSGIGGACLTIGQLNFFSTDMIAGRGFIAVAAFILARWNPAGCILAALLFGFADAIQMRLQLLPGYSQFIQMLPYLCTIFVLSGLIKRKNGPAAIGVPYHIQN